MLGLTKCLNLQTNKKLSTSIFSLKYQLHRMLCQIVFYECKTFGSLYQTTCLLGNQLLLSKHRLLGESEMDLLHFNFWPLLHNKKPEKIPELSPLSSSSWLPLLKSRLITIFFPGFSSSLLSAIMPTTALMLSMAVIWSFASWLLSGFVGQCLH